MIFPCKCFCLSTCEKGKPSGKQLFNNIYSPLKKKQFYININNLPFNIIVIVIIIVTI